MNNLIIAKFTFKDFCYTYALAYMHPTFLLSYYKRTHVIAKKTA